VIRFLQGKKTLAQIWKIICLKLLVFSTGGTRLGFRYHGNTGQSQAFGDLVPRRYLRFFVECVDANFGFSRYAERLGRSANSLTNCMGRCNKNQRISMIFVIDFKENRNDKTYFVLISVPFLEFI
jgi:hypothetical protein